MVDYTIAALPTLYRGRMYRSRLEARWAAFFDRLGWAYEYEPFDLGSWSPDFLLTEQNVLVEIKPLTEFDQGVADKMLDATAKMRSNDEACGLLLPRAAPLQTAEWPTSLGWLWVPHAPDSATLTFHEAMLVWRTARRKPTMFADTATRGDDALWTMSGDCFPIKGTVFDGWRVYEAHALRLWADAANAVQWEPRQ